MKILFVTDLHGHRRKYERVLDTAKEHQADIVINGGDMLPGERSLFDQGKFITGYLDAHFARFEQAGIACLCCLGNDDLAIFDPLFDETCEKYPAVFNLAQKRVPLGSFEFIGMNWVVDYPFRLKDRCRIDFPGYIFGEQYGTGLLSTSHGWQEIKNWPPYARSLPTIQDELEGLVRPSDPARAIYVIHMPPSDLGLDQCGHGPKVGSKAVYNFLQRLQPRLSLHGHIHESPETSGKWFANLGQTVCVQPGQLAPFTYAVIDLETMKLERHVEPF